MTDKPRYDVFLSYSAKDRDWVSKFTESLSASGVKGWFDVVSSVAPGERWQDRIQDALRDSKFLVVILSANSSDSPWRFFELGAALADRKRIIPVAAGDVQLEQIPFVLRQFQLLKEASPSEAGKRVAAVIEEVRGPEA